MPKYKNPLYVQASQYLDGDYAETLSARELQELGYDLVKGLSNEIRIITSQIWQVANLVDSLYEAMALEKIKVAAHKKTVNRNELLLDKHYLALSKRYLARLKMMCRLVRAKCRLLRTHYQIMSKLNERTDLDLFAFQHSPPPERKMSALLSAFIRSSQKTKFFYSKLFRKNMDLTDDQWNTVKHLLPQKIMQAAGRPAQDSRAVLNGIFWKLRTAASWNDLPFEYPSHQTCYRYYTEWVRAGILDKVTHALVQHLIKSGFNIFESMKNGDIELIMIANKNHIRFAPHWQDTWQSSTALLILQVFISKKRKQGAPVKNISQVYPPMG